MPAVETYFIVWKGRRDGPYSLDQLGDLLKRGDIGLLHRVETAAGLVPLKQLLPPTAAPMAEPLFGAPEGDDLSTLELAAHPPAQAIAATPGENVPQTEALRAYTTCGWCFALPPLAWRAWALARDLAARGYPQTAQRLQWLSAGLAGGGVVFWLILVWLLFARRW